MDDLSKIEWHDVQDKAARIDDVEFLSGDLTGTDLSNIEWHDAKPVTQSVLDVRDKKTYNVPVAMDGVDATFAIDTQHNGKDKRSFFGKVWAEVTGDIKALGRGAVGASGKYIDLGITKITDLENNRKIAAGKAYNKFSGVNNPMLGWNSFDFEMPNDDEIKIAQETVNNIEAIRKRNQDFWKSKKEAIIPENEMTTSRYVFEGIADAGLSALATVSTTAVTKQPTASAAFWAYIYGKIREDEYVDKALEQGLDVDAAYFYGKGAGIIEGSIEMVGGEALNKIAKIKPIKDLGKKVITQANVKLASSKLGQKALNAGGNIMKRTGTRHVSSTAGAFAQGFLSEGVVEEGLQQGLGMLYENATNISLYDKDEILSDTLFSAFVGGIAGGAVGAGGTHIYNKRVKAVNQKIKNALQVVEPELKGDELQIKADAVQEILYQTAPEYEQEFNKILSKEVEIDAMPEGLTPESVTAETREILKEKYQMTDEQIDKTIDFALLSIDLRNQFNEAYTHFREGLEKAGRKPEFADGEARILAARALTLAKASKTNVKDVMDRWALRFEESQGAQNQRQAAEKVLGDKKEIASMAIKLINRKKGVKDDRLSLSAFIKKHGGLKDVGGDLKNMDAQKQYVGLINNQAGMSLDDMAQLAWESGYLKTTERPDVNQLLEAIDSDLRGSKVYADEKSADQLEDEALESWQQAFDEAGVDLKNDNINTIYRKMKAYENEREVKKLEARLMFDERNQERVAMLEENGLTHREALEQVERERAASEILDDEIPFMQESLDLQDKINKIDADRLAFERKDINSDLKGRENEKVKAVKINRFFSDRPSSKAISIDDVVAALDKTVEKNENGKRILKNKNGETATLSNNAINKMFDTTAIRDNQNIGGILGKECIANIADIFHSAILVKTHNDIKHGSKNKIHRYANVINSDGEDFIVKITVKELANNRKELTDFEIESNNGKDLAAYDMKVGRKNTAANSLGNSEVDKSISRNSGNDIMINDLIDFVNTYTEKSIEINGVNRSALNSNGERIAKTAEGLQAFYEWFGDSKVVDEQGRPLVVYHQTAYKFDTFAKGKEKAGKNDYETPSGFFFKSSEKDIGIGGKTQMPVYLRAENELVFNNREDAQEYWAKNVDGYKEILDLYNNVDKEYGKRNEQIDSDMDRAIDELENSEKYKNASDEEQYKMRSDLMDSFDTDAFFEEWRNAGNKLAYQMKQKINDYVSKNKIDMVKIKEDVGGIGKRTTDSFIVFDPNQIKSTSNRGTFSKENPDIYYQSAFAGSRVDYDEPSLEAIGSGEGRAVHGWGLYYALNKDVAEGYRRKFTDNIPEQYKGSDINDLYYDDIITYSALRKIIDNNMDKEAAILEQEALVDRSSDKSAVYYDDDILFEQKAILEKIEEIDVDDIIIEQPKGQVHEVDIPENPYLLDEQKPFSEQSNFVKDKLRELAKFYSEFYQNNDLLSSITDNETGGELYSLLVRIQQNVLEEQGQDGNPKKYASQELESLGIKGIAYVGRQDGRCFVIFNPKDVKVIQKFYQNSNNPMLPNNPRGGYKNGIIYLFENNDASTVIHELGHFFLDDMRKFTDDPETSAQLEAVYNYLGSKDGNLTREQHELFADSFEVYLLDGRSPNTLLSKVFARFRRWIGAIYGEVKRLNKIKISDDIKTVFDEMLGGRSLDFAMQTNAAQMADNLQNGQIPPAVVNRALDLLTKGKMSRADMDEMLDKLKTGELKRKEVAEYLKKFENSNNIHHEALNPFDKVKYKSALQKGNFNKKEVKDKIERLLKWSEPKMQGGKLVGKFPNLQLNRHFDHVRELYNTEKYQAREQIGKNIELINAIIQGKEVGDTTQLAFDNKILSIAAGKADASLLLEVYSALSDSYNLGRISAAITGQAKKMRKQRLIMEAYDVLTDSARVDDRKEKMKFIQGLNRLGLSMVSWNGLLDILSMNDKSSKAGESVLSKEMDVFDVEQKEAQGIADDGEHVSRLIEKKLKSNNNPAISLQRYVNTKLKEKFTLEWGDNKKTFTKDQLLDIYMKSFDEETRQMMINDKVGQYNLEFLQQVKELIDEDDAAVVDALFEFYDENYHKINAFYEDKYGTSLGKRPFYSPRAIERGGIDVDTGDMSTYAGFGGVKQRTAKAGTIKIRGAFNVLQNHIVNSNHWIAWADKLIDINAVFGDVDIKRIVKALFGEEMEKRIAYEVSRMASNDKFQSKFDYSRLFNKIRANYATSALALKPALALKQLTSFPAYWEKMSTADFLAGIADFIAHPKQAIETLGQTTLMKTRGVNIIKDFEQLSKTELIKNKANKIKLRELMMFNIKFGDRGAIYMGGWALYKAELKKNLKAGLSEEEAKQKALQTFEKVTDETQQSGRLSEQSYWQSNPYLRAFTMFQSSQNQYLRKEISAVRGLMTGRMDKSKVLKTLFIYHVLLPCFFQAVADGFRWDKNAQLRAALLGSLNGVFILNSVLENLYDAYIGGKGLWNSSLRIRDVVPFWGSGEDLIKFFDDLAEGDVELDDYIDVMRAFGKPVGELTGLPVKYPMDVIKNFGEYAEDGETQKEVLLWLGWSPYALRDLED